MLRVSSYLLFHYYYYYYFFIVITIIVIVISALIGIIDVLNTYCRYRPNLLFTRFSSRMFFIKIIVDFQLAQFHSHKA